MLLIAVLFFNQLENIKSNKKHFLFVYIVKQKQTKQFADFIKNLMDLKNFKKYNKNRILIEANF